MEELKKLYSAFTGGVEPKKEENIKKPVKFIEQQEYTRLKQSPKKNTKLLMAKKKEGEIKKNVYLNRYSPKMEPIGYIKPFVGKQKPVKKASPPKPVKKASPPKPDNLKTKIDKGLSNLYKMVSNDTSSKKTQVYAPPIVKPSIKKNPVVNFTIGHTKKASPPLKKGLQYRFGELSKNVKEYEYQKPVFSQEIREAFPNVSDDVLIKMFPNTPTVTKKGKKVMVNEKFNSQKQPVSKGKKIVRDYEKKFNELYSITENEKGISPILVKTVKQNKVMPMIMEEDLAISNKYPVKKNKKETPVKKVKNEIVKKETPVKKAPVKKTATKKETPKKKSPVKKDVEKKCPSGKILNKLTGRCINADGKTALALKTKK